MTKKAFLVSRGFRAYRGVLALLVFTMPAWPMPASRFGFLPPLFISGAFGLAIALVANQRTFLFPRDGLAFALMFFFLSLIEMFLGLLNQSSSSSILEYAGAKLLMGMLFFALLLAMADRGGRELILRAFLASAIVVSLLIFAQGLGWLSIGNETAQGRTLLGIVFPIRKATGFEMSDGELGLILVPAFLLIYTNPPSLGRLGNKGWRWLFGSIIFLAVLASQSRSAWLGFAVTALLAALLVGSAKTRVVILVGLIAALFFSMSSSFGKLVFFAFVGDGVLADNVSNRGLALTEAIALFAESPLIGLGHDNMIHARAGRDMVIHNLFLDQLGGVGLVGFFALMLLFVSYFTWLLLAKVKSEWKTADRDFIWLFLAMVHFIVEFNLYRGLFTEYLPLLFAFLVSVGVNEIDYSEENRVVDNAHKHNV